MDTSFRIWHSVAACTCALLLPACGGADGGAMPNGDAPDRSDTMPIKIGVLTAALQTDGVGADTRALEWARDEINAAGGVLGRPVELAYMDWQADYSTYSDFQANPTPAVERILADEDILAVIGPLASTNAVETGDLFIRAKVPMVTTAGSASLVRAFGDKGFIWRTRESDIAQVELMLNAVKANAGNEVPKVAMIAPFGEYGSTFFDWFAFLAAEIGLEPVGIERMEMETATVDDFDHTVSLMVDKGPDAILMVPTTDAAFVTLADSFQIFAAGQTIQAIYSDGGFWTDTSRWVPQVFSTAAPEDALAYATAVLEGATGFIASGGQDNGFLEAYQQKFSGLAGPDFDAALYDALLLIAYGLAHSEGEGGDALVAGMKRLVDGSGTTHGFDRDGISSVLSAIAAGENPAFAGAQGPLIYDRELYVEPVNSTFMKWTIRDLVYGVEDPVTDIIPTGVERINQGRSVFRTNASADNAQTLSDSGEYTPECEREELWAVIIALSDGFGNYRHQSDALAQYGFLKAQGLSDSNIIMIGEDDLVDARQNALPGQIHNVSAGGDIYDGAEYDYQISELDSGKIVDLLEGRSIKPGGARLRSGPCDDVYLSFTGHGGSQGVVVGAGTPAAATINAESSATLTPQMFADAIDGMRQDERFRKMLVVIEACHSGVMGTLVQTPGVVVLAAANPFENSLAANWAPEVGAWVADQFAYEFITTVSGPDRLSIAEMYEHLYFRVSGSHVQIYNAGNFGGVHTTDVRDFMTAP